MKATHTIHFMKEGVPTLPISLIGMQHGCIEAMMIQKSTGLISKATIPLTAILIMIELPLEKSPTE